GDGALERVDGIAAGIESGGAMGGADGDEPAGVADFQATEAVDDGEAMNFELLANLSADFAHLGVGHGFVSFVLEVERALAVEIVADEAVEDHHGAVFGSFQTFDELAR